MGNKDAYGLGMDISWELAKPRLLFFRSWFYHWKRCFFVLHFDHLRLLEQLGQLFWEALSASGLESRHVTSRR